MQKALKEKLEADIQAINKETADKSKEEEQDVHDAKIELAMQGLDAVFFDGNYFLNLYNENLKTYQSLYRSEVSKPQSQYYGIQKSNYGKWLGKPSVS